MPSAPKASTAGSSAAPKATPKANANTHTTAQLQPTASPTGENAPPVFYPGLTFSNESGGSSGQQLKDGRIRNPVPSKLKGKTTASSGRFSVMQLQVQGKEMPADRGLAAKRTSENTAMAAQKAYDSGYQPHRKSNWVRLAEEAIDPRYETLGRTTPSAVKLTM